MTATYRSVILTCNECEAAIELPAQSIMVARELATEQGWHYMTNPRRAGHSAIDLCGACAMLKRKRPANRARTHTT